MTNKRKTFDLGIKLKPTDSAPSAEGELSVTVTSPKVKAYVAGANREVVTADQAQTLTNKTVDVDNNTVSNIEVDNLKAGVLNTSTTLSGASDTQVPSALASKTYIDNSVSTAVGVVQGQVDNLVTLSGVPVNSTNLGTFTGSTIPDNQTEKQALQALETGLEAHIADTTDAHAGSAITNTPSGNLAATDVQGALNELQSDVDTRAIGAASSTDNAVARFDGAGGKTFQNSVVIIDDVGVTSGITQLDVDNIRLDLNTISSTNSNGNVNIVPNGTGEVDIQKDTRFRTDIRGDITADNATGANATLTAPASYNIRLTNASLTSIDMIPAGSSGQIISITNSTGVSVSINDNTGGTAANRILTGTKATLALADEASINLKYDDTESRWMVVGGSGSGSGAGNYDTFYQENFETTLVASFASGNNATFLGGGTLQGTLANETSAPIKGIRSAKYTMAGAGSTNDYFALVAITPSTKERGNYVGMDVYHTYDGASGDIKYVVYDVTNSQVLSSSLDVVVNATTPTRTSLSFLLPATCASLRLGAQVVTHNASKIFVFDDVQLSVNPFVYKNLTVSQTLSLTDSPGYGATNTKIRRFTNTQVSSGSNLFTYTDSATLGGSFTFLQACRVSISYMFEKSSVGTSNEGISINSSQLTTDIGSITAANRLAIGVAASTINTLATVSWTGYVAAGDIIRAHGQGTATNTIIPVFSITAQSESENVISAAQSNMTDWATYAPTYNGFGTPSVSEVFWRRNGSNLEIRGRFTPGTLTAAEARVGFPTVNGSILVSAGSSVITALTHASGSWIIAGTNTQHGGLTLMEPSVSYMTFGKLTTFSAANSDPYQKEIGNVGFGANSVTFSASIPIAGWTSDVKFLAAIPVQKVAYLKDVKADTTDGGTFTSGAWQTRTLNTINETGSSTTSSSTFVTLSSNQFTLSPGEYMIDWEAPAFAVDQHQTRLRNITDTTTDGLGTRSNSSSGSSGFSNSIGHIKLTITSSKVYEIQHQCGTTKATNGFGSGTSSFSESVVYSQVKITRLR